MAKPTQLLSILISILINTVAFAGSADQGNRPQGVVKNLPQSNDALQLLGPHLQLFDPSYSAEVNKDSAESNDSRLASDDSDHPSPSHQQEDRRDRVFYPDDTERPKPLFRKLFLNIAYDQEDIFTSPFRIHRDNALEWLIPLAAGGALIPADTAIADSFHNSNGQIRWGGRISNIGASYTLIPIIAGSYIYGAWRDNPKGREIGVLGTETLLDGLIVVGITKESFRPNRPDEKNRGD